MLFNPQQIWCVLANKYVKVILIFLSTSRDVLRFVHIQSNFRSLFSFQHESIVEYKNYIHAIVGFFVIEDHILNTGNGLVTRSYLDEVWAMALTSIINALCTHTVNKFNVQGIQN